MTALQIAEERGHTTIVDMLRAMMDDTADEDKIPRSRRGTFQKIRDWWQRNRLAIKLVSSFLTSFE